MKFSLEKSIPILERTPEVLKRLLLDLDDEWVTRNEGPDTWSPYDVVGHLVHGEKTDWIQRTKIILEHGEKQSFTPFDRFAQFEESKGKSLSQLLEVFATLRAANIDALKALHLSDEDLARTGVHPELGKVTLANLLSTWVVHDLGHIAQVSRVMARQYTSEVGPWINYLGILQ